jgi:16S rRNA (adenine1518-N6/adenine1519-N6)-dimethyltransferase
MGRNKAEVKTKKPRLGQNFLVDESAITRIAAALGDISQATVIEIGPGRAALTRILSRQAGRLIAIELDRVLAAQLRMVFSHHSNVEILEADVLQTDLTTILGAPVGPLRDLRPTELPRGRVVGNLPYYITSDILLHLFKFANRLESAVLMTQLEVADRITATPGHSEYGMLSATTQMYARAEKLFTLPGSAFDPPPSVNSAVTRLVFAPRFEELGVDEAGFIAFLRVIFAFKRKTLANNLKDHYPKNAIGKALSGNGIPLAIRAEAVSLPQMAALYRELGRPEVAS